MCYIRMFDVDGNSSLKSFSKQFEADGLVFDEPTDDLFNFNSPVGACPVCEGYGKVIGIDTPLDAKGNIKLLNEINSDGIKIFYKFQTAIEMNLNICKDLKRLGGKRICAIHASNTDGRLISEDTALDLPEIKQTLDKMGWQGWLIVERSRDVKQVHNVKYNYGENVKYLKKIFK